MINDRTSSYRKESLMTTGYQTGYEAVTAAVQRAKSTSAPKGKSSNFYGWKDKETKFMRFLHDDVITIAFHEYVLCADGKKRDFVCAQSLAGELKRDCEICAEGWKSRIQTVGLAALRVEVPSTSGKGSTYEDYLHELEVTKEDGSTEKVKVPFIGIVKQAASNFWDNLNGYYARYGTTVDRDYEVYRRGDDKTTKYRFIPIDRIDGLETPEEVKDHYKLALELHPGLIEWIEGMGSAGRYERLLQGKIESPEEEAPKLKDLPSSNSDEGFDSLRDELMGYRAN
jgi:hypothetical protein